MISHEIMAYKVHVYLRDTSPVWQCATFLKGRNHRKSTKEEGLDQAKQVAEEWYLGLRGKEKAGTLTFLPNVNQDHADAPAYRIFASNQAEVGGGWEKTAEATGRKYLSVRLDDPTFAAPLYASLLDQEDGTHNLIWSRRT